MKQEKWTKAVAIILIGLFFGASVVPIITGSCTNNMNDSSQQEFSESQTMHSSSSISYDTSATTWDVSFNPSEIWTTPFTSEDVHEGSAPLFIDDASISQPMNNDVLRGGDLI